MPSVRDKACQLATHRRRNTFFKSSKLSRSTKSFAEWLYSPLRLDKLLKDRLGYRKTDMPTAREERVFKTNKKASPGSANHHPVENSSKKSSASKKSPSRSKRDEEELAVNSAGPSIHSQAHRLTLDSESRIVGDCARILNLPLPTSQERSIVTTNQQVTGKATSTGACIDHFLDQELRRRKKQIVDLFMDAIVECIDKNLDALEDEGDGGHAAQSSSGASRTGGRQKKLAGQKRQLGRDDQQDNDDGDDQDGGQDRIKKRTKTVKDDARLKFACPYYKWDPDRFKSVRTCCGPGWHEIHRVKEHLQRAHSLPKYQCNRCCRLFKEEDKLKAHQREVTPCPIQDAKSPSKSQRDLGEGYDQEQDKKLQKRLKGTSESKWREWYSIIFNIKPGSSEIPSPYHDIPDRVAGSSMSSRNDNFQQYREYFRRELPPLIRGHIEAQVETSMRQCGVAEHIKSNVMEAISDIPSMLHRIFQSIPPPAGMSPGEIGAEPTVPPNFDPSNIFDGMDFDAMDGFDFSMIHDEDPLVLESSGSSTSSDLTAYRPASSSTSLEESDALQYGAVKGKMRQPQQMCPHFQPPDNPYLGY